MPLDYRTAGSLRVLLVWGWECDAYLLIYKAALGNCVGGKGGVFAMNVNGPGHEQYMVGVGHPESGVESLQEVFWRAVVVTLQMFPL